MVTIELAPTGRSHCKQCGVVIEKGEKRASMHGFCFCGRCFSGVVQAWDELKGYKEQVKDILLECVGNKTRKLNLSD